MTETNIDYKHILEDLKREYTKIITAQEVIIEGLKEELSLFRDKHAYAGVT